MKFSVFLLVFVILSTSSYALALSTSPQKQFDAIIGSDFIYDVMVFNQEGSPNDYKMLLDGSLASRATATPNNFTVHPPFDVPHRGNPTEDGFQKVRVRVSTSGLTPGKYSLGVTVQAAAGGSGGLSLIQEVNRQIEVNFKYPPGPINKALNFIVIWIKDLSNSIWERIALFYEKNLWLNYLFLTILIAIVFYAGTQIGRLPELINNINLKIEKHKEYIQRRGLMNWIITWARHIFKKLKWKKANDGQKGNNHI